MSGLRRVIDYFGGDHGGMAELARQLSAARPLERPITPQRIWLWKQSDRIPAEFCPHIEKLTGVTCEEMRPDVAWGYLRGNSGASA